MSRDDGFAVADIDSSYLEDAKMRALWHRLRDVDLMARAVVLHKATLLASWRQGERVTVGEAAPIWLPVDAALVEHLQAVRLLDKAGKVAPAAWARWIGPALERRQKRRVAGAAGGRASGKARSTNGEANVQQTSSDAEPDQPAVLPVTSEPSVHPSPDPADDYYVMTGKYPNEKVLGWIDSLTGEYGAEAVTRAIATCHQQDRSTTTLLGRAQDALRRDARGLDRQEKVAELARIEANRPPKGVNVQVLISRHNHGQHADDPDANCPSCRRAA